MLMNFGYFCNVILLLLLRWCILFFSGCTVFLNNCWFANLNVFIALFENFLSKIIFSASHFNISNRS